MPQSMSRRIRLIAGVTIAAAAPLAFKPNSGLALSTACAADSRYGTCCQAEGQICYNGGAAYADYKWTAFPECPIDRR